MMILQFLLGFACGYSIAAAVDAIYQVEKYGQVNNGTVIMLSLSSMAANIVSIILSLS